MHGFHVGYANVGAAPFCGRDRSQSGRKEVLDSLRGALLILIAFSHVPIPYEWESLFSHPLGFISAAEGFFFLSGLVGGLAYTRRFIRDGWRKMAQAVFKRTLQIYLAHLFTAVVFLSLIHGCIFLTGRPLSNASAEIIEQPWQCLIAIGFLVYQPGILDILPTYCVLLAALPTVIVALQRGLELALAVSSFIIWLLTNIFEPQTPFIWGLMNTGAFNIGAWQLLFYGGVLLGHRHATGKPTFLVPPLWMLLLMLALGIYFFGIRHALWPAFVPDNLRDWLTNKNNLAPVRLLNVVIVILIFSAVLRRVKRLPLSGYLSLIGRHSLPVFTAHVVAVLFVNGFLDIFADNAFGRVVGPIIVIGAMTTTAMLSEHRKQL